MYARLIASHLADNQLPTHWTYEGAGTHEGFQVTDQHDAVSALATGEDQCLDDWMLLNDYDRVAFINATRAAGEKGGLKYSVILPEDVQAVSVMSREDLAEAILDIASDHDEDADYWDSAFMLPDSEYIIENHLSEIVAQATPVTPEFVNTLN